jgi:hypothetical protein
MVTKLPPTKLWTDALQSPAMKGGPLNDKGFPKALADYARLDKKKRAERLKSIQSITKLVGELKSKVSSVPAASKYLTEVARVLKADQQEIEDESVLDATIENSSHYDDVFVTIEDLNLGTNPVIVARKRLNKKQRLPIRLQADGDGRGKLRWIAEDANSAASRKEDTVQYIKPGQTIQVRT